MFHAVFALIAVFFMVRAFLQICLLLRSLARLVTSHWASLGPLTAEEVALVRAVSARKRWRLELLTLLPRLQPVLVARVAGGAGMPRVRRMMRHGSAGSGSSATVAAGAGQQLGGHEALRQQTGGSRGKLLQLHKQLRQGSGPGNAGPMLVKPDPSSRQQPPPQWKLFDPIDTCVALWTLARFHAPVRAQWLRTLFASAAKHGARFTPATLTFVFQAMLNYRQVPMEACTCTVQMDWPVCLRLCC